MNQRYISLVLRIDTIVSRMPLVFLMGIVALGWSGYSLYTGKGYYKNCPPGGYDRERDPFNFWAPTIVIFAMGMLALLISLGVIPVHPRQ